MKTAPAGPGPNDGRSTPTGNCTDVSADKVMPYEPMADQQPPAARTLGPMASLPTGVLAHLLASRRENRADTQASLTEARPRPAGPRPENRTRTATVRARFDAQDSGLGPQDVKVRIVDATIRGPPGPKTQRSSTQTRSSQVRSEVQRGDYGTLRAVREARSSGCAPRSPELDDRRRRRAARASCRSPRMGLPLPAVSRRLAKLEFQRPAAGDPGRTAKPSGDPEDGIRPVTAAKRS